MMLRIQKERMGEADLPDAAGYFADVRTDRASA